MSEDSQLPIDGCICARLWYTASLVLGTEFDSPCPAKRSRDDVEHLRLLIDATLAASENNEQYRWISHKLISWLDGTKERLYTIQFHSNLKFIDEDLSKEVEEDLLKLSQGLCMNEISIATSKFLENSFHLNPALTCWFINNLQHVSTDLILQDTCKNALRALIAKENSNKDLSSLLCILSKLNLAESKEFLNYLYPYLLDNCNDNDIELVFYSKKNTKFLKEWHKFVDSAYFRSEAARDIDHVKKLYNLIFSIDVNNLRAPQLNAKELTLRVREQGVHWLFDILNICSVLLHSGEYDKTCRILSYPLLQNLWPALLLYFMQNLSHAEITFEAESWQTNFNLCKTLKFLLNKCSHNRYENGKPILVNLNKRLSSQVSVVEWILGYRKKGTSPGLDQNLSIKGMLDKLQDHCTLQVLKKFVDIHDCDGSEITSLVQSDEEAVGVFRSYRILQLGLRAVLASEAGDESTAEHFTELEGSLNALSPLDSRLELVEDVFAMMFLRHEAHFGAMEHGLEEDGCKSSSAAEKERHSSSGDGREARLGFVCSVATVRRLLVSLRRSLVQLGVDFAKQRRELGARPDERLEGLEALQERIFRMDSCLADACWRLELLTSHEYAEARDDDIGADALLADEGLSFSSRLQSQSVFYKEAGGSSDEESRSSCSSEASSTETGRRSRRRRNRQAERASPATPSPANARLVVNYMLASKESLLLQCLWKADYSRAQQVIEMFDMKNTVWAANFAISKSMQAFRIEASKQRRPSDTDNYASTTKDLQIFERIRRAAQGGYQNSRLASQLETFLASQESNARLVGSDSSDALDVLALCALDLGLTVSTHRLLASSLLDVAAKYARSSKKLEASRQARHLEDVQRLVQETQLPDPDRSVPGLICDATVPLKIQEWREKNDFWQRLLEKAQFFQANQSPVEAFTLLDDVAGLCSNDQVYLHKIVAHLQILHSIIPEDEPVGFKAEELLLGHPLKSYFGRQIFDLNVEPESLEPVANKLGVSLVHNILVNCCPKLAFHDSLRTVGSDTWGCIVLNKIPNNCVTLPEKSQDPNQCVTNILAELIQAIKILYPDRSRITNKDLKILSEDSEIQKILNKTTLLESLDLSELSDEEQTTTFFLNLWNLLFLHAQLRIWISEPPLNSLRHFVSSSSVYYNIGDLGRISLATLRSKLLNNINLDTEFFPPTEDLNEVVWQDLDLVHDPRVIFAMANEFYETPAICIYYPNTLNQDLDEKLNEYLDHYSKKEFEITHTKINSKHVKQTVHLPEIVESYKKCVETNRSCQIIDYFRKSIDKNSDVVTFMYEPVVRSYEILINYEKHDVKMPLKPSIKRKVSFSDYSMWSSRSMQPNVLRYLEGHCWLLSYLATRLHKEKPLFMDSTCDNLQRTACLENISSSAYMSTLADALFHDNPILAAISENFSLKDLWVYLEICLKNYRVQDCLEVINALPCKLLMKSTEIQCLKDKLLCQLINTMEGVSDPEKLLQYIYQIKDVNVLAQTILSNLQKWPVYLCQDALFHALHHKDKTKLPSHCRFQMNETLCRVIVFYKMLPHCKNKDSNSTWQDVLSYTEKTDPVCIVQALVEADKFELCLEWLEYQSFILEIRSLVTQDLLIGLLKNDEVDFKSAHKLLTALPKRQSITLCEGVLKRLESIRAMKFIIEYLLKNCEAGKAVTYYKTQIGVEILDQLEPKDMMLYIHLITEPLLMLEQLLMNCRLKILLVIINVIQKSDNFEKAGISIERFDETVRFYAGKSLDFRVSLQRDGLDSRGKDNLVTSTGSLDSESRTNEFVMPANVPSKEEWIPNDQARECNCCKEVIFSMFNRRHHCRRCGRVVCATCSQQRMPVLGYPKSVPVRVCEDCKRQTVLQMQVATQGSSSAGSVVEDCCWKLTLDEAHNKYVREEFSFEHAPHVSMCLAIMNLHSDHKAYASFLLDHCHEMKRLLQPGLGGRINPEIDHALIIKMIRSLLIAVKMKCAKLGLNAGLAHCDRFLSQVDLIATLVQSDCLALIPSDDSLDEHALRKLRDLLTEKEQWQLALDVSTKAGLETQGVWAAWGKAYLKAGHLDRARTKFSHCLEKVLYENFDDWVMLSYPDSESKGNEDSLEMQKQRKFEDSKLDDSPNRKRQTIKSRPVKNSPLLVEILEILENQSQLNPKSPNSMQPKAHVMAQDILTTLNSLKAISQGQFSLVQNWNSHNIYYEESLYYLLTYGSIASILEFYIKYKEYKKCLEFVLENNVDPEIFFNAVYIRCLNTGNIEKLINAMRAEDPSLLTFKKLLIFTCNSLDKKQFYHSLYHLQLLMRDHTRAAVSCIRFYTQDVRDYMDLSSKSRFLDDAQKHLETELSVESLNKKRRKSVSSSHSGLHGSLTMEMEPSDIDKHINTISRQLEIVKFLSRAEKEGRLVKTYLQRLIDMDTENNHSNELPTLFGNQQQKTRLAVLAILCGRDPEEGFGIAFRIMQDYNLRPQKVYSLAFTVLTMEEKIDWKIIEQLIKCMTSSGAPDSQIIADRVLNHLIKQLLHYPQAKVNSEFKGRVHGLIRLINDVELKISSYLESKQLKNAYLLVLSNGEKLKSDQEKFMRKILKEADRLGQSAVGAICETWLSQMQCPL